MLKNINLSSKNIATHENEVTLTFDDRDLYLNGEITTDSVLSLIQSINNINKSDDYESRTYSVLNQVYTPSPINLYINSIGGCVIATLSLLSIMESSETPIHTYCMGQASSGALMIFIAGIKRYTYKHSIFMYHQLSSENYGTLKDMEDHLGNLKHLQDRLEEIFLVYTDFTKEELKTIKDTKKDYIFYYNEALNKKVADEVIINSIYKKDMESLHIKEDSSEDEKTEIVLDYNLTEEEIKQALKEYMDKKND